MSASGPPEGPYRGRFAPSPTGPLHFGSLVAAMASYADARRNAGAWLVRIEDVDVPRARPRAADDILHALEGYGFEWEGPVWRQSSRRDAYEAALARLAAAGLAYACVCTRQALAAQPIGRIGERVYPGTCRDGIGHHGDRAAERTRRAAVRVRVPSARIAFTDRLHGLQQQRLDEDVGDFVVRRSDGLCAYQLAVVVDDAAQRITDVVRGADLLASTPRQIFLQRALGVATPRYLHVPVAVDARGAKLSKQTAATPLPAAPLPALHAAWRFLGQCAPSDPACPVSEFWTWAIAHWDAGRIPAAATRPAPTAIV
ncbi:MAG TPA: tRNA glutamyl-Q(34) synthetase GluQRS [Casimicrobiaceae bacterium]|nr:tRNA glutamyl-Q(34) synthetase GluQRS [Casimicrobiaceae bacterium]